MEIEMFDSEWSLCFAMDVEKQGSKSLVCIHKSTGSGISSGQQSRCLRRTIDSLGSKTLAKGKQTQWTLAESSLSKVPKGYVDAWMSDTRRCRHWCLDFCLCQLNFSSQAHVWTITLGPVLSVYYYLQQLRRFSHSGTVSIWSFYKKQPLA